MVGAAGVLLHVVSISLAARSETVLPRADDGRGPSEGDNVTGGLLSEADLDDQGGRKSLTGQGRNPQRALPGALPGAGVLPWASSS